MSVDLLPALRSARVAWNKGRIIGQKRPLLRGMSGQSASGLKWRATPVTLRFSTWQSTASCAGATWSPFASGMSSRPGASKNVPQ